MQSIKLWLAALALSAVALDAPAAAQAAEAPTPHLSVLTYNVKGLPWPIAGVRTTARRRPSWSKRCRRPVWSTTTTEPSGSPPIARG